ncbi:alkane 1-monooxygenase [Bacterioplanoides sp.]|uniref:alkane 1-monooxygenase n=1 Tax=Bacterioplanoides sp. TaxID=2066072 RepID=UPI003AFF6E49
MSDPTTEADGSWFERKKYYYLATIIGPCLPLATAWYVYQTSHGFIFWGMLAIFYFGIALLDLLTGKDTINPNSEQQQQLQNNGFYNALLLAVIPLYWLAFAAVTYVAISLPWYHQLGALIGLGAMFAGVFCVSHELGHRTTPLLRWGAKASIAMFGYCHFHIEHNRGHHVHVSTPEDPASSRMGENIYQFARRELPGTFKRAMQLETLRLQRLGLNFWSWKNDILQTAMITLVIHGVMIASFGWSTLPFLIAACAMGYFQLTMANYLEHYGLLRQKKENGRYEKCQPQHSWNCNNKFSNYLTLQLQRHSDHHANATREYQILRDHQQVPLLPAGYPLMMFISIIPPLWRRVMDKRLLAFVKHDGKRINFDPQKKQQLMLHYQLH